jgi:hypothetical protein
MQTALDGGSGQPGRASHRQIGPRPGQLGEHGEAMVALTHVAHHMLRTSDQTTGRYVACHAETVAPFTHQHVKPILLFRS